MPTEIVNVDGVDPAFGAMRRLREPLHSEAVGLTLVDCEAGWEGPEHDHGDQNHEEVYLLLDGRATVTVDGETAELGPGDAVRLAPEETRQVHAEEASRLVFAGANR